MAPAKSNKMTLVFMWSEIVRLRTVRVDNILFDNRKDMIFIYIKATLIGIGLGEKFRLRRARRPDFIDLYRRIHKLPNP